MNRECSVCGTLTDNLTCADSFCGANTVPVNYKYRFSSPRTGNKSVKELPDDREAVEYSLGFDDVLQASIEKFVGGQWVDLD